MIRFEFGAADLAGLRFAHSPMAEVVASCFAWRSRGGAYAHWRVRVDPSHLSTFSGVLFGPHGSAPDFLTPVPSSARPTLDEELALIGRTPADVIAEQVLAGWTGFSAPPEIRRFERDPHGALAVLSREIRGWFEVAVAPYWPRLRDAAEAEIAARARRAAAEGSRALVDGLHPLLDWDGSALLINYAGKTGEWSLDGHDLALLPTGFAGSNVFAMRDGGRALWYAPRGYAAAWSMPPPADDALSALLGPTRAAVLTLVAAPHSTGEVARSLGVAPATASHHLTTLRDSGLVAAGRAGRKVIYQRTTLGDRLTGK